MKQAGIQYRVPSSEYRVPSTEFSDLSYELSDTDIMHVWECLPDRVNRDNCQLNTEY